MREKAFRFYWRTLDDFEWLLDQWAEVRHSKIFGLIAMIISGFNALIVAGCWWLRSL